jgi:RNA polymerase sigma-70 factor (ECF subfamily)
MTEHRAGEADEAELVRAVAGGSEDALATLYDRHVGGVHAVALRLTGDRGVAEEVAQEVFLALWNRAEMFDPALASLTTWLRAIARNRAVDRLRAAGRRPAVVSLAPPGEADGADAGFDRLGPDTVVIGGAAPHPGPEAAAEAADLRATVVAALAGMPESERTVIVLAYREELTQQEIAERLGWPLGTVKTRTRRALARLRGLLEAGGAPAGAGSMIREDDDGPR